jgi:ribosomal protein S27AE
MTDRASCSYCGGTEFFRSRVVAGGTSGSLLAVGALHGPFYENRVCGKCGHTAWFVSPEHLPLVREKLERLP